MAWNKEKAGHLFPFLGIMLLLVWSIPVPVESETVAKVIEAVEKNQLKCYVCNDGLKKENDTNKCSVKTPVICSDFFKNQLGGEKSRSDELKNFPKLENMGWKWSSDGPGSASNVDFSTSGFETLEKKVWEDGYKTCVKQRIVVEKQDNPGAVLEIKDDNPRIIKYCSFETTVGCKEVKQGHVTITTCHCKGDDCNGSSVLRVSHWIFAAFLLIIGAQVAMMK